MEIQQVTAGLGGGVHSIEVSGSSPRSNFEPHQGRGHHQVEGRLSSLPWVLFASAAV